MFDFCKEDVLGSIDHFIEKITDKELLAGLNMGTLSTEASNHLLVRHRNDLGQIVASFSSRAIGLTALQRHSTIIDASYRLAFQQNNTAMKGDVSEYDFLHQVQSHDIINLKDKEGLNIQWKVPGIATRHCPPREGRSVGPKPCVENGDGEIRVAIMTHEQSVMRKGLGGADRPLPPGTLDLESPGRLP